MNEQARSGTANLTLVEPDCIHEPFNGAVDIGIIKDNIGGLAAQFEGEGFPTASRCLLNVPSDRGRACEGDLIHIRIDQRGPCAAVPCDDIHHTRGHAGLAAQIGKEHGGHRRIFRGLEHNCIAHRQGGGDFPSEHEQRKIPRDNLPANA